MGMMMNNMIDLAALTKRFGLSDHEQSAVLAWTGESVGHLWTVAEADRLATIWVADAERIADLGAPESREVLGGPLFAEDEDETPDPIHVLRGIIAAYVPQGEESHAIAVRCLGELRNQRDARQDNSAALADVATLREEHGWLPEGPHAIARAALNRIEAALRGER